MADTASFPASGTTMLSVYYTWDDGYSLTIVSLKPTSSNPDFALQQATQTAYSNIAYYVAEYQTVGWNSSAYNVEQTVQRGADWALQGSPQFSVGKVERLTGHAARGFAGARGPVSVDDIMRWQRGSV